MRKNIFFITGVLFLILITKQGIGQNYFIEEYQNKKSLNLLIEEDSTNSYMPSEIYSDIWLKSLDVNNDDAQGYYQRAVSKLELGYLEEAIEDINKSIEIDSTNSLNYGLRALCHIQLNKDIQTVLPDVEKAIELDEENGMFYNVRGLYYLRISKLDQAEQNFNKALEINKEVPESYFYLGIINISNSKYSKAKNLFKNAIKLNEKLYEAYLQIALCEVNSYSYNAAIRTLDELINIDPDNINAYLLKGDIFIVKKEIQEANSCFSKVLEIDQNNFQALIKKSLLALSVKDYSGCYNYFGAAISNDSISNESYKKIKSEILSSLNITADHFNVEDKMPDSLYAKYKRGVCLYISGNYYDAYSVMKELVLDDIRIPEIYGLLGVLEYSFMTYANAAESFEKALELDPKNVFLNINMGVMYSLNAKERQAAKCFLIALRIEPDNPKIYYLLSKLNEQIGNKAGAVSYLNTMLEIEPDYPKVYIERAMLKKGIGDISGAALDYEIAIKYDPYNYNLYLNCADLKANAGEYDSAIKYANIAKSINRNSYVPDYMIGNTYYKQEKYEQAIRYYNKAKSKAVSNLDFLNYDIAFSNQQLNKKQLAINFYKKALYKYKNGYMYSIKIEYVVKAYIYMGKCLKDLNKTKKAEMSFIDAINVKDRDPNFELLKSECFNEVGEYSYSIMVLENFLGENPSDCNILYKLGRAYKLNGQADVGLTKLDNVISIDSTFYLAYSLYGRIKYETGDYNESLKYSEKALSFIPEDLNIKANIAICELALGEIEKAKLLYQEIKKSIKISNNERIISDLDDLIEKNVSKQFAQEIKGVLLSDI